MELSVVIPAYNEEGCIAKTVQEIFEYLQKQDYDFEVIVVSDGSQDQTVESVKNLTEHYSELSLLELPSNQGKGAAVRQGVLKARGAYILYLDADHATDISELDQVWPHLMRANTLVIGSRNLKNSRIAKHQPWTRVLLGRSANLLIRALLLPGIHDTQCGFKIFAAQDAQKLFQNLQTKRWAFDIEILAQAKKSGLRIKEIPVTWTNSAKTSVRKGDVWRTLKELSRIRKIVNKKSKRASD